VWLRPKVGADISDKGRVIFAAFLLDENTRHLASAMGAENFRIPGKVWPNGGEKGIGEVECHSICDLLIHNTCEDLPTFLSCPAGRPIHLRSLFFGAVLSFNPRHPSISTTNPQSFSIHS
jgi:hypothetical protein